MIHFTAWNCTFKGFNVFQSVFQSERKTIFLNEGSVQLSVESVESRNTDDVPSAFFLSKTTKKMKKQQTKHKYLR